MKTLKEYKLEQLLLQVADMCDRLGNNEDLIVDCPVVATELWLAEDSIRQQVQEIMYGD